nr:MAG TPA: hypothetical protein [Caudoviricetes sp.]
MLFFWHSHILYIQRRLSRNICRICRSLYVFIIFLAHSLHIFLLNYL